MSELTSQKEPDIQPLAIPGNFEWEEELAEIKKQFNFDARKEPFILDTEAKCNWALGKMADVQDRKARITANYQKMMKNLDSELQRLEHRFSADLEEFARVNLQGQKKKTLSFLNGKLSFRSVPSAFIIADRDAALIYCKEYYKDLVTVTVTEAVRTPEYKSIAEKVFSENETLLPGLELKPASETFYVKPGAGD